MLRPTVLAGLVVTLAGCAASTTPTAQHTTTTTSSATTTATLTTAQAAARYLAIVAPANKAISQLKAASIPPNATGAQVQQIAAPTVAALRAADQQLLRVAWPSPTIRADVVTLVTADAAMEGDLTNLADQNAFSITTWGDEVAQAGARMNAAVSVVRADLGLPPVSA